MVEWQRAILACLVATASAACGGEEGHLLLATICSRPSPTGTNAPACRVSGDAELTTGLTPESLAVRFGSASGALHIRINAIDAILQPSWSLEVLAAARPLGASGNHLFRSFDWGSCALECPQDAPEVEASLEEDFAWVAVVEDLGGTHGAFVPDDATLTLRGADIDLLDLRTPGFSGGLAEGATPR
jgi:hypothetical protein